MLMIRFQRIGRTNDPAFRIAVLEKERAAKAGNVVELLGTYNPRSKALTLNEAQVKEWILKGAQPTDSIRNLLITKGIIEGKKVNVLPKKTPQKNEAKIAEEAAAVATAAAEAAAAKAVAEAPVAEAASEPEQTVEAPTEAEIVAEGADEGSAEGADAGSAEAEPVAEEALVAVEEAPVVEETPAA